MPKSEIELLEHILEEIVFLKNDTLEMNEHNFLSDEVKKRAYARSLEIIGEAVKNLPASLVLDHSDIPWRKLAGMRDKLIHGYFSVNYKIVWDVASKFLPEILPKIQEILCK